MEVEITHAGNPYRTPVKSLEEIKCSLLWRDMKI